MCLQHKIFQNIGGSQVFFISLWICHQLLLTGLAEYYAQVYRPESTLITQTQNSF